MAEEIAYGKPFIYTWRIENLKYWNSNHNIDSPDFILPKMRKPYWCLKWSGNKFYMVCEDEQDYDSIQKCKFQLTANDGSIQILNIEIKPSSHALASFNWQDFFAEKSDILNRDSLTVIFSVWESLSKETSLIPILNSTEEQTDSGLSGVKDKNITTIEKYDGYFPFECKFATIIEAEEMSVKFEVSELFKLIRNSKVSFSLGFEPLFHVRLSNAIETSYDKFNIDVTAVFNAKITDTHIIFKILCNENNKIKVLKEDKFCFSENLDWHLSHIQKNDLIKSKSITFIVIPLDDCGYSSWVEKTVYSSAEEQIKKKCKLRNESELQDRLATICEDDKFSDVILQVGNKTFHAHRAILSAWSSVFTAMFETNMLEKNTDSVVIPDLNSETMSSFLAFLYSGAFDDNLKWDEVAKLYFAADKYQVLSLVEGCSDALKSSLSVDNFCDVAFVADNHEDEDLKSALIDFALKNVREILSSEDWAMLKKSRMALANDILSSVCLKMTSIV